MNRQHIWAVGFVWACLLFLAGVVGPLAVVRAAGQVTFGGVSKIFATKR